MKFVRGEPISKLGAWCSIFSLPEMPRKCVKILADNRGHNRNFPHPAIYAKQKYGIEDLLVHEFDNYQKIISKVPGDLRRHFVKIYEIGKDLKGDKGLIMDLIIDDQGKIASNLVANHRPLSPDFFLVLERLRREVFIKHGIDYFGIACRNILVKDVQTPVLIDFQKNHKFFRYQPWLKIPFMTKLKVNRYFKRVYAAQGLEDLIACKKISDVANFLMTKSV